MLEQRPFYTWFCPGGWLFLPKPSARMGGCPCPSHGTVVVLSLGVCGILLDVHIQKCTAGTWPAYLHIISLVISPITLLSACSLETADIHSILQVLWIDVGLEIVSVLPQVFHGGLRASSAALHGRFTAGRAHMVIKHYLSPGTSLNTQSCVLWHCMCLMVPYCIEPVQAL
jgi:hypothetical protein